jgi:cobalt/nickel transport system permease protein
MDVRAMHIANGIVNGPVSAVFAGLALAALAVCVARGRRDLDDRLAPMAGLVAAFVFAAQMLNFGVAPGVSGHLLGGTLAAILVGPWLGAVCVAIVLIVQSLVFADGGVTAIGLNITNMALIGTAAGYLVVALLLRVLPRGRFGLIATAFVASVVSVVAASMGFVVQYALGGSTQMSLSWLAGALGGVHLLIGIGEGVITASTVAAVAKVRPDLVYALRRRDGAAAPAAVPVATTQPAVRRGRSRFVLAGLAVSLVLAGVVSNFASGNPDGLDATARTGCTVDAVGEIVDGTCIAAGQEPGTLPAGPLADYGVAGVESPFLSTGAAGVAGVAAIFLLGLALFRLVRRREAADRPRPVQPKPDAGHALYLPDDTPVHRLAPEAKVIATVAFTVVVVLTPREAIWAFVAYGAILAAVATLARVPARWLATRSLIEVPFVVFALVLPFLGGGERATVLGLDLSVEGMYGAWNILAKGTLGVLASLLLAATTTTRDLILGLDRLRCPQILTQIATFMLRYLDVLVGEARRMRIARLSRGDDPRFLWQLRGFAAGIGALFLRAYERGERVYLAMLSRGYDGRMPAAWHDGEVATAGQWMSAATVPVAAAMVAVVATVLG